MITTMLLAAAYTAGSLNFAILLFKMLGKDDPRKHFSRNAGVTNVYRQAGFFWSGVILLLDTGRAMLIAWVALYLLPMHYAPWIGLALIIGNRFPCFHRFRGGKGVAGYLGFTCLIAPFWAVLSALLWLVVYAICRIPFVASLFMIVALMVGTIIACGYQWAALAGAIATAFFIFYNHRKNWRGVMRKG